ncbi:hypothetical protein B566_EDAN006929 [Ephemera danica]|nr:hypothetical protein B566_EDAN006929 [Ephemera danica]
MTGCEYPVFIEDGSTATVTVQRAMSPVHSKQHVYRESKQRKLAVTQPKLNNVFVMNEGPGIKTHPTGGARTCSHGAKFEREMAMLWTYRAYHSNREYDVAIEDERTGKFDDYYLGMKLEDGTFLQQFVQLKHSSKKESELTFRDLFPKQKNSKNVFDLKLYFKSFVNIKKCPEFNSKENTKDMFILFTNKLLTFSGSEGNVELFESVFETIRDTEILNTNLWKFKDEFIGREILQNLLCEDVSHQEYTDKFLKNFYIAHSQPDEPAVSELIKSELCHDFKGIHCENAYNRYCTNFLDWYNATDGNKGTKLNHSHIHEYFAGMKGTVVEPTSFEVTDPTPNFYGREDIIANIHNNLVTLNKPASHLIDVSISGMSGVGKTEIARYYAKKYRSEYDYILWLNTSSSQSLETSFQRLKMFLDLSDNDMENNDGIAKRVGKGISKDQIKRIYSFLESYKCLFIFDSEFDLLQQEFQTETRKYLPLMKSKKHHIIVTTNKRRLLCNYEEHVVKFSEIETLGFLKQNLDSNLYNNDSELNTLGLILSNVTIGLQIAISYIKEQNRRYQFLGKSFTVNDFLSSYQQKNQSILDFKCEGLANKSLITICELSIQSIVNSKEKKRSIALKILYIIAHLQPDHIPTKMFVSKEICPEDLMDAISILENLSLITVSPGYLYIHRLTQDILRAKLEKNSNEMKNTEVRKCRNSKIYYFDKTGRILCSVTKRMTKNGKYTKEFILLSGLDIFDNSFKNFIYAKDNEQLMIRNFIVRHTLTFILYCNHCINKNYITRVHFEFILSTIRCVSEHGMCLQCIDYLRNLVNNLENFTWLHDSVFAKFFIYFLITEKCLQVGDYYHGLDAAMECQNIIEKHEIPFPYILTHSIMNILLLKNVGKNEESFEAMMKLYIIFDEYKNKNSLLDITIQARTLGKLLQEHFQFIEATKVYETTLQQESSMCQKNLITDEKKCQCVESALVLSQMYSLQKKHYEAKKVLLSAQKCTRMPTNDVEIKTCSIFLATLCHSYYQCGETSKALSVLDQVSNIQLPSSLEAPVGTIYFKMFFKNIIAIFFVLENEYEQALDILRAELYKLLVIFKSYKILNFNACIKFGINNVLVNNIAVTHSQTHPFKLLLFHIIRLSNSQSGFEIAHAELLKIEKSVVLHFGEANEIFSYILMCKLSLYHQEKQFESEMQTWVKLLQVLFQLSKDSNSVFMMFRMTLIKFLNSTQHLEQDIDSVVSESLLAIVNDAIRSAETSLFTDNQNCAPLLKQLYFDCLILTNKYESAKNYGFELLSSTYSNNIGNVKIMFDIYLKLAILLHKNKKESVKKH